MSIKDNVAFVKKELSGDEQVLESALKLETLYKKYKIFIWAVIVAIVLFFVAKNVMGMIKDANLIEANQAFLTLQEKPKDTQALKILEEKNPTLFELFSYAQAVKVQDTVTLKTLVSSTNSIVSDASNYALATLEKKPSHSTLYKEMGLINEAYLAIQSGNIKKAKNKLTLVPEESALASIASLLTHTTLKAK